MRETALHRFETLHPFRAHTPAASAVPARAQTVASVPVGPYALRRPQTAERRAAQERLARGWLWGHLGLSLLAAIAGVTLIVASPDLHVWGAASLSMGTMGIALSAPALGAMPSGRVAAAAHWLLLSDFVATAIGRIRACLQDC